MQHPYVYGVLIFEAMATFIGQVSVLSLIAIFGAATTAMVLSFFHKFLLPPLISKTNIKRIPKFIYESSDHQVLVAF